LADRILKRWASINPRLGGCDTTVSIHCQVDQSSGGGKQVEAVRVAKETEVLEHCCINTRLCNAGDSAIGCYYHEYFRRRGKTMLSRSKESRTLFSNVSANQALKNGKGGWPDDVIIRQ